MEIIVGAGVLVGIWLVTAVISARKKARREELMSQPLKEEHKEILAKNLKMVDRLPENLQKKLHGLVNVFLDEKDFTGCNGLEITDEMRVTIAAQACLLLLNNKTQPWYKKLHTVLVYPSAYKAVSTSHTGDTVSEKESIRLGESWGGGSIVLSWSHSRHGGVNFEDGQNLVLHEFAHQLDQIDGAADGIPTMETQSCYLSFANVLSSHYKKLVKKAMKNQKSLLDKYGATNEAEFFSVATECFFEKPRQLKKKHPDLYEQLSKYYGLNPVEWL